MVEGEEPGKTRKTVVAAAALFLGFALLAYFLPAIMMWAGAESPWAAALIAAVFIALPFVVLALRARSQRRKD